MNIYRSHVRYDQLTPISLHGWPMAEFLIWSLLYDWCVKNGMTLGKYIIKQHQGCGIIDVCWVVYWEA